MSKKLYARKGEKIITEFTHYPVMELTKDIYEGDPLSAEDFRSICELPDPQEYDLLEGFLHGDWYFRRTLYRTSFHFEDGWR